MLLYLVNIDSLDVNSQSAKLITIYHILDSDDIQIPKLLTLALTKFLLGLSWEIAIADSISNLAQLLQQDINKTKNRFF